MKQTTLIAKKEESGAWQLLSTRGTQCVAALALPIH
jgi:hypothetical protein